MAAIERWIWSRFPDLPPAVAHGVWKLRQDVFVVEQACAYADLDGRDPDAWHLVGERRRRVCATLRVLEESAAPASLVSISRVVVREDDRRRGLGEALMREGIARATATFGPTAISVSAQAHLEAFYASLGFTRTGAPTLEDGLPHVPMRRPPHAHDG